MNVQRDREKERTNLTERANETIASSFSSLVIAPLVIFALPVDLILLLSVFDASALTTSRLLMPSSHQAHPSPPPLDPLSH